MQTLNPNYLINKRLQNSYDYNEYTALKCLSETILRLEFYSQNHYNWHGVKYGLDYFWTIFGPFLDHFIGGMYTISTQGGVGCSLSVLREGWEAECYYSGRGERRSVITQ